MDLMDPAAILSLVLGLFGVGLTVYYGRRALVNRSLPSQPDSTHNAGDQPTPVKLPKVIVRRPPGPVRLTWVQSGKDLLSVTAHACDFAFDHDEPRDADEKEGVSAFLQSVQDWGEIADEIGASGRVDAAYDLSEALKRLEERGFKVYAARVACEMDVDGERAPWPRAMVTVRRVKQEAVAPAA